MIEIGGRRYHSVRGSDVDRDGIHLVLRRRQRPDRCSAVFYSDANGFMTFTTHQPGLPIEVVEWLIAEGRKWLPPSA